MGGFSAVQKPLLLHSEKWVQLSGPQDFRISQLKSSSCVPGGAVQGRCLDSNRGGLVLSPSVAQNSEDC